MRMRISLLLSVSFLAISCGLSANPDLPSADPGGGMGAFSSGDGDAAGDGDMSANTGGTGFGGDCGELGGAGGMSETEDPQRALPPRECETQ
jgi:hypothetical protein